MAPSVKIIRIPRTPATAFDQHREISDLVRNQVRHAYQELHEWWRTLGGVEPGDIETEQQAADYLKAVTRVLHPQGTHRSQLPPGRPAKSGVVLGQARVAGARPRRTAHKTSRKRR